MEPWSPKDGPAPRAGGFPVMITFLRDCRAPRDNGSVCGDGCCWNAWWESEDFVAGDTVDACKVDVTGLIEGTDYTAD